MKNLIAFVLVIFSTSAVADSEVNAGQLPSNDSVTSLSTPNFNGPFDSQSRGTRTTKFQITELTYLTMTVFGSSHERSFYDYPPIDWWLTTDSTPDVVVYSGDRDSWNTSDKSSARGTIYGSNWLTNENIAQPFSFTVPEYILLDTDDIVDRVAPYVELPILYEQTRSSTDWSWGVNAATSSVLTSHTLPPMLLQPGDYQFIFSEYLPNDKHGAWSTGITLTTTPVDQATPLLTIQAQVNDQPTTKPGPLLSANTEIIWTYSASNDGNTVLHNIDVLRRQKLPALGDWETVCTIGAIEPGQSGSCEASEQAQEGKYLALVVARGNTADGGSIETSQKAFYSGTAFKRIASGGQEAFSVSNDGRYITYSTFRTGSMYLLDRVSGATTLIGGSDDLSVLPSISGDGHYIAFYTETSTNLIVNVHDRISGETTQIAVASDDVNRNLDPDLSISEDGRYIAFIGDFNKLFIHDRVTSETTPVNPDSFITSPAISADGRYIAFESHSSDLVPNDTNRRSDIFVYDRITGTNSLISVATNGSAGNETSSHPSISSDGRYVVFSSYAENLVPDDTNNHSDIFIRDRQMGITSSISALNQELSAGYFQPSISAKGQYITYNLLTPIYHTEVFIYDRINATLEKIVQSTDVVTFQTVLSPTTIVKDNAVSSVIFISNSDNLVPDDTNDAFDIFLYEKLTTEPPILPPVDNERLATKRTIALELLEVKLFDQITHDAYLAEINAANSVSALHEIILRMRSADIDNTGSNPRLDAKRNIALGVLEAKGFDQATHDALLTKINAATSVSELHAIIVNMRAGTVSTTPQLALSLAVTANGSAIERPGASIPAGSAINWTYTVTNDGNAALHNIVITQRQKLPSLGEWVTPCTITSLAPGATESCSATTTAITDNYKALIVARSTLDNGENIEDKVDAFYRH